MWAFALVIDNACSGRPTRHALANMKGSSRWASRPDRARRGSTALQRACGVKLTWLWGFAGAMERKNGYGDSGEKTRLSIRR